MADTNTTEAPRGIVDQLNDILKKFYPQGEVDSWLKSTVVWVILILAAFSWGPARSILERALKLLESAAKVTVGTVKRGAKKVLPALSAQGQDALEEIRGAIQNYFIPERRRKWRWAIFCYCLAAIALIILACWSHSAIFAIPAALMILAPSVLLTTALRQISWFSETSKNLSYANAIVLMAMLVWILMPVAWVFLVGVLVVVISLLVGVAVVDKPSRPWKSSYRVTAAVAALILIGVILSPKGIVYGHWAYWRHTVDRYLPTADPYDKPYDFYQVVAPAIFWSEVNQEPQQSKLTIAAGQVVKAIRGTEVQDDDGRLFVRAIVQLQQGKGKELKGFLEVKHLSNKPVSPEKFTTLDGALTGDASSTTYPSNLPDSALYNVRRELGQSEIDTVGWVNPGDILQADPYVLNADSANETAFITWDPRIEEGTSGLSGAPYPPTSLADKGNGFRARWLNCGAMLIRVPGNTWQILDRSMTFFIRQSGPVEICLNDRQGFYYENEGLVLVDFSLTKSESGI